MKNEVSIPEGNAWTRFWFTPIPTTGLHCLRLLTGLLLCFWLLAFVGQQRAFFSLHGWLDRQGMIEIRQQNLSPTPIEWSVLYLAGDSAPLFQALYWGSIAVLLLFALGVATRVTGVLTWIVVVSFLDNPVASYEGDYLFVILAFYLMVAHLLQGQWNGHRSLAERILGPREDFVFGRWLFGPAREPRPLSVAANLTMRLMQIHMAIIMVTMGLHKLQMGDWWAGVALWYPMHPPLQTTVDSLKMEMPHLGRDLIFLSLLEYIVLAWEIAFPVFAWRTGWARVLLLGGAMIYWLGVFFLFRLPEFGPFVFLGCLSYLRPAEWAWLKQQAQAMLASKAAPASKKVVVVK